MTPEEIKEQRDWLDKLAGYTPGPWTFETESGDWPDQALIGGDGDPVLEWDFDLGFSVTNTNAALIAAAPDLHAHLTAALDEIERLRVAVEEIAAPAAVAMDSADRVEALRDIARAALEVYDPTKVEAYR